MLKMLPTRKTNKFIFHLPNMYFITLEEGLIAIRANGWVIFLTQSFPKPLSTGRALQFLSRMHFQMLFQDTFICEALLTLKTLERLLSCVSFHVTLEISF